MTEETTERTQLENAETGQRKIRWQDIPWQIWVVVVVLAVEGVIHNLALIPKYPIAAFWFAGKCLLIYGLLKSWRCVFVAFLVIGAMHAIFFAVQAPAIGFMNLALVVLTAPAMRFYFPKRVGGGEGQEADNSNSTGRP
jgi:hypothetical protein